MTFFLESTNFMPVPVLLQKTAPVITQRDLNGQLVRSDSDAQIKKYQRPVSRIFSSHSIQSFRKPFPMQNEDPSQ